MEFGFGVIALSIFFGLNIIANAIRYKRTDVNFTGPIKFVHGSVVDFERGEKGGV